MPIRPTAVHGRSRRIAALYTTWLALAMAGPVAAAPGDVLFSDSFESGFGKWTTTNSTLSGVNAMTASSPSRSLYVRGSTVATTSIAVNTKVPAVRVRAWIRRGSDKFSEQPDSGDDLRIEYLDSSGAWASLGSWAGSGTAGAILELDQTLAGSALHTGFRMRIGLLRGSGGPPDNAGVGWDYWHIDDIVVSETMSSTGLDLGRCEEFNGGLTGWTVAPGYGRANTTGQAVNTASQSLAVHGGTVTVTSQSVDLAKTRDAELRFWLRRGSDAFSEDPDVGEDFYVEYLNSSSKWTRLASYPGDGSPGEIKTAAFALPGAALHGKFQLRFGMTGRNGPDRDYWHVDSVCLTSPSPTAEWRFEESRWGGVADEVVDGSENGQHGTAYGDALPALRVAALPGNPGSCAHAVFDGDGDGISVPGRVGLDRSAALTYAIWMQPHIGSGKRHLMGMNTESSRSDRSQMAIFIQDGALIGRAVTRTATYSVKAALPALKTWSHVALAFDGKSLVLLVDARAVARADFAETTLVEGNRAFEIGNEPSTRNAPFFGYLDEARVYPMALDTTRLAAIMKETHGCATTALRIVILHDGRGAHCQPETMRVRVHDLFGNPVTTYSGLVTLDTQTGTGSWLLVRGDGRFLDGTAEDGRATYRFAASDAGEASFALHYSTGPSTVDVDAFDGGSRDDDSEGNLVFAPASFSLTANAVPSPAPSTVDDPLDTRTAGAAFPLHLTAFGGTSGGASCGVVDSYDGDKALRFWADHLDPSSAPLVPTIDQRAIATSEAAAATQLVHFNQGRAVVSARYKDTGLLDIQVVDSSTSEVVRGSTGSFASLPADLRIAFVANDQGEANPGVSEPAGKLFARAGEPFRVTVDVIDAEGSRTPSFGKESSPEGLRIRSAALVAPIGGRNGASDEGLIENGMDFSADVLPGRFVGKTFAFDEVGAIRLQASVADADFLGAGPIEGTETGTVGRFAPSRFEAVANAPKFATACRVGAFTWLGQPFHYVAGEEAEITVTAVNLGGATTANYAGDWFRIDHATLTGRRYRAAAATTDESGLPSTTADPAIQPNNDGTATLRFSTGSGLALARSAPIAPFDAELELSLEIADADATIYPENPFRVGGTAAGTGIAFDTAKRFQFGRLRVDNAYGSELVTLPMRLRAQRFDGTAFADDDSDSCSTVTESALILSPSPAKLATLPKVAHVPLFSGDAGLVMSAPGAPGDVGVRINLGATGANLPWLRSDWPEDGNLDGTLDDDPQARATFGIWEGRDAMIFLRELY